VHRNTKFVVFACFMGAWIGALLAISLGKLFGVDHFLMGAVGVPVGAGISWLSYYLTAEPKRVRSCIARAWQEVVGWNFGKCLGQYFFRFAAWFAAILSYFAWIPITLSVTDAGMSSLDGELQSFFTIILCISTILGLLLALNTTILKTTAYKQMLLYVNPIVFPFTVIGTLLFGICKALKTVPIIFPFIKRSAIYIHTSEGRVVLVAGALGATIGIVLSHALLGGIAGALIGVFSYEVFSVRVFKLVPKRIK
jgi:hypothetical protein